MKQWEDIIEVPIPLPFALKIMNAYLIKGKTGYTIVDTGLHDEAGLARWEQAQKEGNWSWADVEKIVLTHYHPDHYGLAGLLQQKTKAPVYMSKTDFDQAQLFFSRESNMPEQLADFYAKHGLTPDRLAQIPGHMQSFYPWVEPHPEPEFIEAGETIQLGDREYVICHTPGHADGHLSFYDPEREFLIGGDFLLPKITPNISLWPACHPNPLQVYLQTLEKMKSLPVKRVFPAHGSSFTHYRERIDALIRHHEKRLASIKDKLKTHGGCTAYDLCRDLFGTNLNIHNLRFALAETLAHLEYLRINGAIGREWSEDQYRYFVN
ncbi:MBL fold metallo-hydrolase [Thermoactinomyces intermedius]|jgi:glyoxylase-like metal-dependent hydrolase (beta-lactamase superfamily II)|uniref:MBL fold metallo-hydrolase n=1 Tax=Thermoactinomyces intermedius TaxID=2024 RepID=A0A8I1ADA6_THEIN|nr:MBL fold metallo-hydrolase [Thermoactinomyces intermedius]MBA4549218.1 MBL fold metallo-hydrolase [Thermoactinomyces intermedius]MBA4836163.1 MBL fold metallo-hydrolase [Thermoactinomyces intermedius]MBH8595766.1 MBL fold metallo-hydrolase [Thermoactinomyces intermedius]